MPNPELTELLARGGWRINDPRPTAAAHPDTFELPTPEQLAALGPGSLVRARFDLVTMADVSRDRIPPYDEEGRPVLVVHGERMWLVVTGVADGVADCILEN